MKIEWQVRLYLRDPAIAEVGHCKSPKHLIIFIKLYSGNLHILVLLNVSEVIVVEIRTACIGRLVIEYKRVDQRLL